MKIITEEIYYEKDVYEFPPRHILEKPKKGDMEKTVLAHKKGELKEIRRRIEKYCCDEMEEQEDDSIEIYKIYASYATIEGTGCFLKSYSYDGVNYVPIKHCPFCGRKIIVVKEK